MEKIEKGTGILLTVGVAEYNDPAWDTWVVDINWKKEIQLNPMLHWFAILSVWINMAV